MSVNVITRDFEKNERKYPCLMAAPHFDKKQIILVTGMDEENHHYIGTNINGIGHKTGYYGKWDGDSFEPYNGSVTIESNPREVY